MLVDVPKNMCSKHLFTGKNVLRNARSEVRMVNRSAVSAVYLSVVLFFVAVSATAQENKKDEEKVIEEIMVVGYQELIRTSIADKRDGTEIADTLSTKDIGGLPAVSLGEVIQTITGAGITRQKGGGTEISIRGLGPFLGATRFNGRDATSGSGNRSVNFSQFPSELVNKIKIYKSQRADLVEGGVGGTIEIGSVRPLDYGKRRIQLDTKVSHSPYASGMDNSNDIGWRSTASYVDQFELGNMGHFGVSIGVQRYEITNPQDRMNGSTNWHACDATVVSAADTRGRYPRCTDTSINLRGKNRDNPFYLAADSYAITQQGEEDVREAVFGAMQWQPKDELNINLDLQYSRRKYAEDRHSLVFEDLRRIAPNPVVADNGVLLAFAGSSLISTQDRSFERAETYQGVGFNLAWQATYRLTLSADLAYSNTVRDELDRRSRLRSDGFDIYGNPLAFRKVHETRGFDGFVPYTFDARGGDVPSFVVDSRFDVTDHSLFSDDLVLTRIQHTRQHTIKAASFEGIYLVDGAWIKAVKTGVRVAEMTYDDVNLRNDFRQNDRMVDRAVNETCRIDFPQDDFMRGVEGATITSWAAFNLDCLYREYTGSTDIGLPANRLNTNIIDVSELTYAAYVITEFYTHVGYLPFYGNFSARLVQTEDTSLGWRAGLMSAPVGDAGNIQFLPTGDFGTVKHENDHVDFLPSINVTLELKPELFLRGAVYKALARPKPSQLGFGRDIKANETAAGFVTVEEAIKSITANGSPGLTPLRAWNADLSLEWYPNKDTLLSAAVYYKQFEGGRVGVANNETFDVGGTPVTVSVLQTRTTDDTSELLGLELTLIHSFTYLPALFNGLGVRIGYNYADTDYKKHDIRLGNQVDVNTGQITKGIIEPGKLSGFSEETASVQLFYKVGKLDLRGIYKYRSGYNIDFLSGNNQLRYVASSKVVDLRASYRFSKKLLIQLEARNVTDEPVIHYMPVKGSLRDYQAYGPTYYLGIKVNL